MYSHTTWTVAAISILRSYTRNDRAPKRRLGARFFVLGCAGWDMFTQDPQD